MDRRKFLTAMAGVAGAVVATGVATRAEAASLDFSAAKGEPTAEGFFKKLSDLPAEDATDAQYYYYRRRRRRCWLRRTYYGWRRVCRWW
jgi:hypothetical protein